MIPSSCFSTEKTFRYKDALIISFPLGNVDVAYLLVRWVAGSNIPHYSDANFRGSRFGDFCVWRYVRRLGDFIAAFYCISIKIVRESPPFARRITKHGELSYHIADKCAIVGIGRRRQLPYVVTTLWVVKRGRFKWREWAVPWVIAELLTGW